MLSFRRKSKTEIASSANGEHWMFIGWRTAKQLQAVKEGRSKDPDEYFRYLHLQALVEQGIAKWEPAESPKGCLMEADEGCQLSSAMQTAFKFPTQWNSSLKLIAPQPTHSPKFTANLQFILPMGKATELWKRNACLISIDGKEFTLTHQQLNAIKAFEYWKNIPNEKKTEANHQHLLANLQKSSLPITIAHDDDKESTILPGAKIDVGFSDLEFQECDWQISLIEQEDGGMILVPTPATDDSVSISAEDVLKRLKHLQTGNDQATLRIGKKIITLSEVQTTRARDLIRHGRLSSEQKEEFIKNPTQYLCDNVFNPDALEWSPRVIGIKEWEGSVSEKNEDGGMGQDALGVEKKEKEESPEDGEKESGEPPKSDEDPKNNDRYLPYPHLNLSTEEFSECSGSERIKWGADHSEVTQQNLDLSIFKKGVQLKKHQEQAVKWMLAHNNAIETAANGCSKTGAHFASNRGGLLFADDMGLGKTISVLSFFAMRQRLLMSEDSSGAFLIVAPVSLLINWKNELDKFFLYHDIFKKVIILHTEHDLPTFRVEPKAKDQIYQADEQSEVRVKKLGLWTHDQAPKKVDGIDEPGNIVLTNYETVRSFRFSFCAAKWEALALDEAQATKNPSVMTTASVKALNAKFRVLMTGTPVENSLVDFWCLNDTHSPGLLCSLSDFKQNYITRIRRADPEDKETRQAVADEIKSQVGNTLLRRMKKDILDKDFPEKHQHNYRSDSSLKEPMTGRQLELYEKARCGKFSEGTDIDHHLALLHQLRIHSLHPDLSGEKDFPIGNNKQEAIDILSRSVKGRFLVNHILPDIKTNSEKVLIFAISKKLQWGLARNLEKIYPTLGQIPIINGDTKIKTTRSNPSRQQLIDDFQKAKGFHICILSPVAAGVGLTITAANHVVHFERHWNPAKEAQATDRAYRIGQEKDVHVWYPMALHPDSQVTSFDQALDKLMQRKMQIQDSILSVEDTSVDNGEIVKEVFLKPPKSSDPTQWNSQRLKNLHHSEFEALIACLYEKCGASRCELTRYTGDSGADIVAYDYPNPGTNTLVDAKHTSTDRGLTSQDGIKQVTFSRGIYQDHLGITFQSLQLVSNSVSTTSKIKKAASRSEVELVFEHDLLNLLLNAPITSEEISAKLLEDRLTIS